MPPTTPLRRQYLDIKKQYPDVLLLFRLGDFYETFEDDAKTASRVLGITLTSREMGKGQRFPMAGIPYHALNSYLGKLIAAGHKVAICEQTSDPEEGKGLVDRGVSRVVTPGTVVEPDLLQQKSNNYLAAVVVEGDQAGLAYVDITTGEFATTQLPAERLTLELGRLAPAEIVHPHGTPAPPSVHGAKSPLNAIVFELSEAAERLQRHFGVTTLEAYGCAALPLAVRAAGAVLSYVGDTQRVALQQIASLFTYSTEAFMVLDAQTRRNLELLQGGRWGATEHSLLTALDATKTAMGGRLLRRWLGQPLLDITALNQRLDAVAWFFDRSMLRGRVVALVSRVADLERLCNRMHAGVATPKEVVALRHSLELVPQLRTVLDSPDERLPLDSLLTALNPCTEAVRLIATTLADDPPAVIGEGGVIRVGFNPELDQLRGAGTDARTFLANLEKRERERSGIKSLKVGYNRVFGYYIEISHANSAQVPTDYTRKQTLTGGERYITPELKQYESMILNAQERTAELEAALFRQLCQQVSSSAAPILATAQALAELDVYTSLAEVAVRYNYTRPILTSGDELTILNGRHPVVERNISLGTFVPNDTQLSNQEAQLVILTGPNMAGKSTYLRQVGVIVLMAQMGSFVPADSARIGVVDRIFTRVGLQDDLAAGQSTFMVEMVETAQILNNATRRSLLILDEIGRGTSTYDGLSIARAVAEHIHNHPRLGAKTLFATHYHELTEMADYLPRVRNYHVAVAEERGEVVFLHKIIPGGADKSYGVHVAQLAGLPKPVVARAREVLTALERDGGKRRNGKTPAGTSTIQMQLFSAPSSAVEELLKLDITALTPLEAITKLFELQAKAKADSGSRDLP